jgi:hypothetical protein
MAMLCGRVDTSIIQLVGRWRSDVMLRYLYLQASALMNNLSSTMLRAIVFNLIPGQDVPNAPASLLSFGPLGLESGSNGSGSKYNIFTNLPDSLHLLKRRTKRADAIYISSNRHPS